MTRDEKSGQEDLMDFVAAAGGDKSEEPVVCKKKGAADRHRSLHLWRHLSLSGLEPHG